MENQSKNYKIGLLIKLFVLFGIVFSISVTYYVMIIQKNYSILQNPDGPDTSDYFE